MLSKFSSHRLPYRFILRRFSNVPTKTETNNSDLAKAQQTTTEITEKFIPGSLIPAPKSEFGPGRDPYSTFPNEAKSLLHQTLTPLDP